MKEKRHETLENKDKLADINPTISIKILKIIKY